MRHDSGCNFFFLEISIWTTPSRNYGPYNEWKKKCANLAYLWEKLRQITYVNMDSVGCLGNKRSVSCIRRSLFCSNATLHFVLIRFPGNKLNVFGIFRRVFIEIFQRINSKQSNQNEWLINGIISPIKPK